MVSQDALLGVISVVSFGCLGWAFNLAQRISVIETEYEGLKDLINVQFDGVNQRLGRIEVVMNGSLKGH